MNFLWLTWKDHKHPAAGGAEVVLWQLAQRLVRDGHRVTFLTCNYDGASAKEVKDGIEIIRIGRSRYLHSAQALLHYLRRLRNKFDVVIEVVNTAPYFGVFFGKRAKRFLMYHQLAREIWFHETKAPLSHFGYYVLEPLATRLLGQTRVPTITVSESTRRDLIRYGFRPEHTHVISEGIEIEPLKSLQDGKKFTRPTLLSLGAMRAMKRTKDHITAFELAKQQMPDLQLKIAGLSNDAYGQEVLHMAKQSPFARDIEYLGKVSRSAKINLMRRAHLIMQTALKEGWGLTITEAASQGTPAVVYDVDGLRDSVRHTETGFITPPEPKALAEVIVNVLTDKNQYTTLRRAAWEWANTITFDKSYQDFSHIIGIGAHA